MNHARGSILVFEGSCALIDILVLVMVVRLLLTLLIVNQLASDAHHVEFDILAGHDRTTLHHLRTLGQAVVTWQREYINV
jgi:hypothetical protein